MTAITDELAAMAELLVSIASDMDAVLRNTQPEELVPLATALAVRQRLHGDPDDSFYKTFALVKDRLDNLLGVALGPGKQVVPGIGVVTRHSRNTRTAWDKEAVLKDVLDTRLVDKDTGELLDESPLDKVLTVFNLPAPRVTALRERGLEPEDYCTVKEVPGYTLEIR